MPHDAVNGCTSCACCSGGGWAVAVCVGGAGGGEGAGHSARRAATSPKRNWHRLCVAALRVLYRLIGTDYAGKDLLVLGVLKGAFMFTSGACMRGARAFAGRGQFNGQ